MEHGQGPMPLEANIARVWLRDAIEKKTENEQTDQKTVNLAGLSPTSIGGPTRECHSHKKSPKSCQERGVPQQDTYQQVSQSVSQCTRNTGAVKVI